MADHIDRGHIAREDHHALLLLPERLDDLLDAAADELGLGRLAHELERFPLELVGRQGDGDGSQACPSLCGVSGLGGLALFVSHGEYKSPLKVEKTCLNARRMSPKAQIHVTQFVHAERSRKPRVGV